MENENFYVHVGFSLSLYIQEEPRFSDRTPDPPRKHFDGEGLFLHVTPAGSKLWRMIHCFESKAGLLSFGRYPTVSLRTARSHRDEARSHLDKGVDPSVVRKQQRRERKVITRDMFENFVREGQKVRTSAYLGGLRQGQPLSAGDLRFSGHRQDARDATHAHGHPRLLSDTP